MLHCISMKNRNKSLQVKDILLLMESVGCDSGENPQAQLDLHSRAGWPKSRHAWMYGDGPPKHSKSPYMVANVHNGEGECQVVCLPMKMWFSKMKILYHRWIRVIHKTNVVAYLLFSESTPTVPTRKFFRILSIKGHKKYIAVSLTPSKVSRYPVGGDHIFKKWIFLNSDLQRCKNSGNLVTEKSEGFVFAKQLF